MKKTRVFGVFLLFFFAAVTGLSAQSFFSQRTTGTFEVQFTSNVPGTTITIDGSMAGVIPITLYLKGGPHVFTWLAPGGTPKTITYPIVGDTQVPYTAVAAKYPLTIRVNVPNASLFLDNAPISSQTQATVGSHTLRVTARGYVDYAITFDQPANANNLNINLVSASRTLTLAGIPTGRNVVVLIDNKPAKLVSTIEPGPHTIKIIAAGFLEFVTQFEMPAQDYTFAVSLMSQTYPLTVRVNIPNATIMVDGQTVPNPAQVASGSHNLQVQANGYEVATVPFTMPTNATTLSVNLNPIMAKLFVKTERLGNRGNRGDDRQVKIFVNGVEQKRSPIDVAPGTFTLKVEIGGMSAEGTFTIASGQTLTVVPNLILETQ